MPNDQLVTIIQEKFRKGERRDEIRADLEAEGYDSGDINEAIAFIQREALKQLPVISTVLRHFEEWEKKTANASPKFVLLVLIGSMVLVAVISVILYISLDPLGIKASERDTKREADFIKIRTAVQKYYQANNTYPQTLNELLPSYLNAIPHDPKTGGFYTYRPMTEGSNFELCVVFETKPAQCLSTLTDYTIPQVQNTTGQQVEGARDTNYHAL